MESGAAHISRAARQCTFPASFQLVVATNPCPCGGLGHDSGRCHWPPERIARYRTRVSGPLLDRLDLATDVSAVSPDALVGDSPDNGAAERSSRMRERVAAATGWTG